MSYYSELRYKEIIDIHTGFRLGYVCDLEFDDREGCIRSLVTPGRPRFFGLLGSVIQFAAIILVQLPAPGRRKVKAAE